MAGMAAGLASMQPLPTITRDEALEALAAGETLVSGNRRLARSLRELFHAARRREGARAWLAPSIAPWESWTAELWAQAQNRSAGKPLLRLGSEQELLLWERIIADAAGDTLLAVEETASVARDAWTALHEWQLGRAALRGAVTADVEQFRLWADALEGICGREGWIDAARASAALPALLDGCDLPDSLLLAGFDALSPVQVELIDALRARGTAVRSVAPPAARNVECVRYRLPSPSDEIRAAALWARRLLDAGEPGPIGVVVPDLAVRRSQVERIFREALDAPSLVAGRAASEGLLQISAGTPLSSYGLVRAALLALELIPDRADLTMVSAWLRSEYAVGGEAGRAARARLDRRLRERGAPTVLLRRMSDNDDGSSAVVEALRRWAEAYGRLPNSAHPAAWSETFSELVGELNPVDPQALPSEDRQVLAQWNELLVDFAALGATSGPMRFDRARRLLERMAAERMFQPEGEAAPVEVLGLLEASGAEFSHLWIARLDDETWPGEARPNPFLPFELQRDRGLPHASPERELEFARTRFDNLVSGAERVVVSYPEADKDRELGPSPLIRPIAEQRWDDAAAPAVDAVVREGVTPELFADPSGPPLPMGEPAPGGSKLFAHQAHCPFQAYAELRLQAEELPSAAPGLDARERGTLVHVLLEKVWEELGGSEGLDRPDLDEVIDRGARQALAQLADKRHDSLPDRFYGIELRRLTELARQWLQVERGRETPFEVIAAERSRTVSIGGLSVRLQVDRVDELPDGRHALIDYKTGEPHTGEWDRERSLEPQVPLYAVTHPQPVAGALFAQVRAGAMKFRSAVVEDSGLPGASRGDTGVLTPERLELWRENLERLAAQFLAGAAEVDPRDGKCAYCRIGPLCRVNEVGSPEEDSEGDSPE